MGNNGADWTSLATGVTAHQLEWNTTAHDDGIDYLIRVIVSDGEFSVSDDSDAPFELDNFAGGGGDLPFGIDLMTLLLILGLVAVLIILGYVCNKRRGGSGPPPKKTGAKKKPTKKK